MRIRQFYKFIIKLGYEMMLKSFLIFPGLSILILSACNTNSLKEHSDEDLSGVTDPTAEGVYSDFEPYIREENVKGTEDKPYKIGEKALAKVGYWGSDLEKQEAYIEIDIVSILLGNEVEDPDEEVPGKTQRVLAQTNVKMVEGPEDEGYPISLQPIVYDGNGYIAQEFGSNPFLNLEPVRLGESRTATIEILAPEGNLKGKSFILDTGLDQVWFEF